MQTITLAMSVDDIIGKVQDAVWGWPLIILILAAGVWLTVRTGFVQVRHLGKALKFMVKNEDNGEGEVTSFGALCTALSAHHWYRQYRRRGYGHLPGWSRCTAVDVVGRLLRYGHQVQRGLFGH